MDVSAPNIVGAWYYQKDHSDLIKLAESGHLWSQRIAMLATFYFIKRDDLIPPSGLQKSSWITNTISSTKQSAGCFGKSETGTMPLNMTS